MDIRGYPVRSVWCETGLDIEAELYLGITLDRDRRRLVIIFSAAGGMEIEQVAVEAPERIAKLWPDPFAGPQPYEIRQLAFAGLAHAPQLARSDAEARQRAGDLTDSPVPGGDVARCADLRDQPAGADPDRVRSSPPTASSRSMRTRTTGTPTLPRSSPRTRPATTVAPATIHSRSRRGDADSRTCISTATSAASATVPG